MSPTSEPYIAALLTVIVTLLMAILFLLSVLGIALIGILSNRIPVDLMPYMCIPFLATPAAIIYFGVMRLWVRRG